MWLSISGSQTSKPVLAVQTGASCCSPGSGMCLEVCQGSGIVLVCWWWLQITTNPVWYLEHVQAPLGRFPSLFSKPRGSWVMQRTAEFKEFSYLWIMFGREWSHTGSFKPAQRRAVWAWQQERIWPYKHIHKPQREPWPPSKLQCCPNGSPLFRSWERLQEGMAQDRLSDIRFPALCSDREFFSVMGSCEQPLLHPPLSLLKQWMAYLACYCLGGKYTSGKGMKGGCGKAWLL